MMNLINFYQSKFTYYFIAKLLYKETFPFIK